MNLWEGAEGEPGDGTGGRGDAGPISEQLAWVRAQEEQTHRQRRRTNVLVVIFCCLTLGASLVILGAVEHQVSDSRHQRDQIILVEKQILALSMGAQSRNVITQTHINQVIANQEALCRALGSSCTLPVASSPTVTTIAH